jgi:hypothetical protein
VVGYSRQPSARQHNVLPLLSCMFETFTPCCCRTLPWLLLWKSPHHWRTDKLYIGGHLDPDYCQHVLPMPPRLSPLASHLSPTLYLQVLAVFADDGKTMYSGEFVHTPRSPFPAFFKTAR